MLKRMLIPAMLQEIRSGNGDDDGPTTLRFCKGCVAATVTTRRPCDYGVERLLGCTKAVATLSLICSPRDTAEGYDKHKPSQICRKFATCRRKFATCHRFATRLRKFATSVTKLRHAVANLQHPSQNCNGPAPASATALPRPGPDFAVPVAVDAMQVADRPRLRLAIQQRRDGDAAPYLKPGDPGVLFIHKGSTLPPQSPICHGKCKARRRAGPP